VPALAQPGSAPVGATLPQRRNRVMIWIIRILFMIAALITALFVARDASNFSVIQMLVSVMLITAIVGATALWSMRRKL
jgi:hypothetical protein